MEEEEEEEEDFYELGRGGGPSIEPSTLNSQYPDPKIERKKGFRA